MRRDGALKSGCVRLLAWECWDPAKTSRPRVTSYWMRHSSNDQITVVSKCRYRPNPALAIMAKCKISAEYRLITQHILSWIFCFVRQSSGFQRGWPATTSSSLSRLRTTLRRGSGSSPQHWAAAIVSVREHAGKWFRRRNLAVSPPVIRCHKRRDARDCDQDRKRNRGAVGAWASRSGCLLRRAERAFRRAML